MFEDVIDIIDKFAKDTNIVLVGILLLVLAFVLSFCYKTFWGRWDDRSKQDQIYGEPGANSRGLRTPRKHPPKK